MNEFPNTEDEKNWSVFLFDCPKDKVGKIVVALFKHIKEIIPNSLPNYTMRTWDTDSIRISFRVLRDRDDRGTIQKLEHTTRMLLERDNIKPIINPEGEDAKISGWDKAPLTKCKAYNRLSEFVVSLAEENLFEPENRNEIRHLAINMLFMREATEHTENYVPFMDLITNKVALQPYPIHIQRRKVEKDKP